jgi:hypothetical protein
VLRKLEDRYNHLQKRAQAVFEYLEHLEPEALHQKPQGHWSAAQIVEHLLQSEKGTIAYLQKKMQTPPEEIPKGGLSSIFRSFFLSRALKNQGKKYRAPKVLAEPAELPDLEVLIPEFRKNRKQLAEILELFNEKMARKAYFKHPVAGRLTIEQTLVFLEDHFNRHAEQIKERTS